MQFKAEYGYLANLEEKTVKTAQQLICSNPTQTVK